MIASLYHLYLKICRKEMCKYYEHIIFLNVYIYDKKLFVALFEFEKLIIREK